jgi:hypothetical protein
MMLVRAKKADSPRRLEDFDAWTAAQAKATDLDKQAREAAERVQAVEAELRAAAQTPRSARIERQAKLLLAGATVAERDAKAMQDDLTRLREEADVAALAVKLHAVAMGDLGRELSLKICNGLAPEYHTLCGELRGAIEAADLLVRRERELRDDLHYSGVTVSWQVAGPSRDRWDFIVEEWLKELDTITKDRL